jgi:hypothetical protein
MLFFAFACVGGKDDKFVDKVTTILNVKRLQDKAYH